MEKKSKQVATGENILSDFIIVKKKTMFVLYMHIIHINIINIYIHIHTYKVLEKPTQNSNGEGGESYFHILL